MGPERLKRYSSPMLSFPQTLLARTFNVFAPSTLYTVRSCR